MPIEHVLTLPVPPSVNELWSPRGKRGKPVTGKLLRHSDVYEQWISDADRYALLHKPKGGWKTITGPFTAEVVIDKTANGKADLDNRGSKALLDFCQRLGLVANDKNAQKVTMEFGAEPVGCRVTLRGE